MSREVEIIHHDVQVAPHAVKSPKRFENTVAIEQPCTNGVIGLQKTQIVWIIGVGLHPLTDGGVPITANFINTDILTETISTVIVLRVIRPPLAVESTTARNTERILLITNIERRSQHVHIIICSGAQYTGMNKGNKRVIGKNLIEHRDIVVGER